MKYFFRAAALLLSAVFLLSACSAAGEVSDTALSAGNTAKVVKLDPEQPVTVTIWHYYNGIQQAEFSEFVSEFNATAGAQQGIYVEEHSLGSVNDLNDNILASARREVGADELPDIFAAYADIAFSADQLGVVADIAPYFSKEEMAEYIPGYLQEGSFSGEGTLKIFPTAKSTEIMMVNKTDWDVFARATGTDMSELETIEGITETAKRYYEWTDSLTPEVANDGHAMFGRDAFANYMLIGARQLGTEIFQVKDGACTLDFDKDTLRKLWDNYYVPMVAGWFAEDNRFRSDDIKMGNIICCVGSTASAAYFPTSVLVSDTESYPIHLAVMPAAEFRDGEPFAVQQGAGMVVTKNDEKVEYAATVFLKWFTQAEQNAAFSVLSGYMPVTLEASNAEHLEQVMTDNQVDENTRAVLETGIQTVRVNQMYTPFAFQNGTEARDILNTSMPEKAAADRAAFLELLSEGVPYEEAIARFDNDKNFDAWYADTLAQLEAAIAES